MGQSVLVIFSNSQKFEEKSSDISDIQIDSSEIREWTNKDWES